MNWCWKFHDLIFYYFFVGAGNVNAGNTGGGYGQNPGRRY